jgi:O-antigen/teichoic acid export membrane protein
MSAIASARSVFSSRSPREMALYAVIKAVSGIAGLLAAIVVTRTLGAEAYGFYSTSWFLVLTCSTLGFSWLGQCVLRFQVEALAAGGPRRSLAALGWSAAVTALAAALSAFLTFHAHGEFSLPAVLCLAAGAVCLGLTATGQAIFQSQLEPASILRTELVKFSLLLVLPMLLAWRWHGHFYLALGIFFALAGGFLVSAYPLRRLLAPAPGGVGEETGARSYRAYFTFGFSLTLFSAGLTGLPVIERYFLLNFFDPTRAGQYIGVYDIVVRGFTVGLMPITLALHPRIMNAYTAGDLARSNRLIQRGLLIQVGLAVVMALGVLACSPILFRILKINEPFSWPLLLTLCGSGAAWQIALIAQKPLERANQTHAVLMSFALSLLLIIFLDGFLPRLLGLAGIALSNVTGAAVYLCLVGILGLTNDRARVARSVPA